MNCTLFSDILKTFNSALPVLEQSPYDFFIKHFLSPIDDSEVYDFAAGLTTSNFSLYYTNKSYKRPLPKRITPAIQRHLSWDLPVAISSKIHERLQFLYATYLPDCLYPQDDTETYSNLVRLCCTGDHHCYDPDLHFPTCSFAKFSAKSDKFIGRHDELSTLSTILNTKKKLCISGDIGIGKTFLVKNWLYFHKDDFSNIAYLRYVSSFESSLQTLKIKNSKQSFHTDSIKKMSPDSLLIIDDMNGITDSLKQDLQDIFSLPFYVIVITRNANLAPNDCTLNLQPLSPEDLMSFFPETKITHSVLSSLINAVNANTFMLSLISKAWAKQIYSESFIKSIMGTKKPTVSKNGQKFKILYTGRELTYLGHIREIMHSFFYKNILTLDNLSPLNFVSCIPNSEININFFLRLVDKDIKWFHQMLELGVFSQLTPTTFFMPQLVADAFYFDAYNTFSFNEYCPYINYISNILCSTSFESPAYEQDISYVLYKFILRFSPFIRVSHNKAQQTISSEQQNWCNFIYASVRYMQSLDMIGLANDLLKNLINTSSDLLYENVIYPVNCLNFFNSWILGSTSGMKNLFSDVENFFHGRIPSEDDRNYIICILLDQLILEYIHCEEYIDDAFLTYYNTNLSFLKGTFLTMDRYDYYQNIYHLLSTPATTYAEHKKLIDNYFNSLQHYSDLHIKLYGFCFGIHMYRNFLLAMWAGNKCTPNQINLLEMELATAMHTIHSITNNATLLPQLDFQMAFAAYSDYFRILSLKFDVTSTADACIHMLLQKAPYLTAFEKNSTINVFHQNIFESSGNNQNPQ